MFLRRGRVYIYRTGLRCVLCCFVCYGKTWAAPLSRWPSPNFCQTHTNTQLTLRLYNLNLLLAHTHTPSLLLNKHSFDLFRAIDRSNEYGPEGEHIFAGPNARFRRAYRKPVCAHIINTFTARASRIFVVFAFLMIYGFIW